MQSEDCTEKCSLQEETKNSQPSPAETTATQSSSLDFEDDNKNLVDEIFMLCRQGHESSSLKLLKDYPEAINSKDETGTPLLHWAALVNATKLVEFIIGHRDFSEIDYQLPKTKHSALMWAVATDSAAALLMLIHKGSSFKLTDSNGATPLIIAIQKNSSQSLLILGSADLNKETLMQGDCEGSTAAHWAAASSYIDALQFLRLMNFDFSVKDKQGVTPLVRSIKMGRTQSAHVLIENCGCGPADSIEAQKLLEISKDESSAKKVGLTQYLFYKISQLEAKERQIEYRKIKSTFFLQNYQFNAQEYSPYIPSFFVAAIFAVNFLGLPTVTKVLIGQGNFYFFAYWSFWLFFVF
eukprot:GHVP01050213.1.p1 GENE.GHVP01050213.1~~GHVP01050213.1.p1  ORF type:complete len:353 (+),score=71.36 GHVP01050213.1:22-1080(+)